VHQDTCDILQRAVRADEAPKHLHMDGRHIKTLGKILVLFRLEIFPADKANAVPGFDAGVAQAIEEPRLLCAILGHKAERLGAKDCQIGQSGDHRVAFGLISRDQHPPPVGTEQQEGLLEARFEPAEENHIAEVFPIAIDRQPVHAGAAVGVYGVMSYGATQRTREIGIRMALGATPRVILSIILQQGVWMVISGVAVGLLGAAAIARLLGTFLVFISMNDPLAFALIPVLLAGIALAACYIPARRAMRLEPMAALRHE